MCIVKLRGVDRENLFRRELVGRVINQSASHQSYGRRDRFSLQPIDQNKLFPVQALHRTHCRAVKFIMRELMQSGCCTEKWSKCCISLIPCKS